jgi:hypothetical protein
MTFNLLTVVSGLLALLGLWLTLRVLLRGSWFLAWLRGMLGLSLLLITALLIFTALDIYSYRQLSAEKHIATLSFSKTEPQSYQVSLVDSEGHESKYSINGDLWQLDARLLTWKAAAAALGLKPGYRLERLSGRYYSLEQEQRQPRSIYALSASFSQLDVWALLHSSKAFSAFVNAQYGNSTYMPMADGALYSVHLNASGLIARPLNEPAIKEVNRWQ